ncbi:hypothetical protein Tco_1001459, partial [Tanacetum coccineum]
SILQAGNPVKEFLLNLNLPDHRTLKDGSEGTDNFSIGTLLLELSLFLCLLDFFGASALVANVPSVAVV